MSNVFIDVRRFPFHITMLVLVFPFLMQVVGCGNDRDAPSPIHAKNVATPEIEGPISGGLGSPFIGSTTFDLAQVDYSEAEYFILGSATAYTNVGPLSKEGKWSVIPGPTATYKTRILVYRPIDRQKFNGTVIVEWLNVSGGVDAAVDWIMGHTELIREGFAWVGVSAQYVGVEGGFSLFGLPLTPLKTTDPERYASLTHPGDSFSYDIFSQAAQTIRHPKGTNPLGDLSVETLIAVGVSQSASRMVTYINALHPLADIYDGFLVHSRIGFGFPLSERPQASILVPNNTMIRSDLNVPVLTLETETDVTLFNYLAARQPDSARFRLWEVAGTAHSDTYTVAIGAEDLGNSPDVANLVMITEPVPEFVCREPINSGPQHFVLKAAIASLNKWVRDGTPPPTAPRLEVSKCPWPFFSILRDEHGNALGGIRTPQVDVPIATLSGEPQLGSLFCLLFGNTMPFDDTKLASLYPNREAYVSAFNEATDRAVQERFLLPEDAKLMKAAAAASDIGS